MKKLFLAFLFLFMGAIFVVASLYYLNDADKIKNAYIVYNQNKYEIIKSKPKNWIALNQISRPALWAIIVSEDWAFYEHNGIDIHQIKEAVEDTIIDGEKIRGASTISQQVVKNALYTNERSYIRKLKEFFATIKLERNLSKNEILEQYINLIELGSNLYGVKEASAYYFSKHPKDLTAKEGAFLAMLLPSPRKYSVSFREKKLSKYAHNTIRKILVKLRQAQIITEEERLNEQDTFLSFEESAFEQSYF